jgi:hypothetical protein
MKISKNKIIIGVSAVLIFLVVTLLFYLIISSGRWDATKKVDGLVITDADITFNDSTSVSFLSANVKNSSKEDKEDVKLKITFLNKSKKEITSVTGFLGDIESKKTRELNVAVSKKLKDVYNIKYEILK